MEKDKDKGEKKVSHIFDADNFFFSGINKILDYIFVSFLWLLCSIPIITIGASTTALYYTTNKVIRNERGDILPEFFKSFRSSFKQSTTFWIFFLLIGCIVYFDIKIVTEMLEEGMLRNLYKSLFYGLSMLSIFGIIYIFPYIARFSATNTMVMINSCFMMLHHMIKTILATILSISAVLICWLFPIALFFMPCVWARLLSTILESIFKRYMSQEDLALEERRNQRM